MRFARNFFARPADEQRALSKESWCDTCGMADLGIASPVEFEKDGRVYLEGTCPRCGSQVITELVELDNGKKS